MTRIKKGWDMIKRNVDRIRRMVLDVLYYAKEREPDFEDLEIEPFANEVCDLFDKKAEETGIAFERRFEPDLGTFEADPNAMRSMLVNILENSFEACRADTKDEKHTVAFACKRAPDHVVFEINDNGIGMDRETRDKIFTLFFSSKGTAGTGLGLFISNKIATKHNGKILLDSVPGTGSTFRVSIPYKQPDS
jgi:signal transduction histidine kinase